MQVDRLLLLFFVRTVCQYFIWGAKCSFFCGCHGAGIQKRRGPILFAIIYFLGFVYIFQCISKVCLEYQDNCHLKNALQSLLFSH